MFNSITQRTRKRARRFAHFPAAALLLALVGCARPSPTKPAAGTQTGNSTEVVANQSQPAPPPIGALEPQPWQSLFDGKTLTGWREAQFGGRGEARVENGNLVVNAGTALSGVNCTSEFPKINYEFALEAQRVEGSDFFCGITFPVGDTFASFIVGGWGCCVVGLSSINGEDASSNETSSTMAFEKGRWYRIRLRVTTTKIEAWIDDNQVVDLETAGKKIALRYGEIEFSKPFGLATWVTAAAWRDIRLRKLAPKADSVGK